MIESSEVRVQERRGTICVEHIVQHTINLFSQAPRFIPHLHNPNAAIGFHFRAQTPQPPPNLHPLHHLHHNEPETSTAIPSTSTINSLINAERIPSNQMLGLNAQEASILNFLRVDAAEKQRDRR